MTGARSTPAGTAKNRTGIAITRACVVKLIEYPAIVLAFTLPLAVWAGSESIAGGVSMFLLATYFGFVMLGQSLALTLYFPLSGVLLALTNLAFPRRFWPSALASVAIVLSYGAIVVYGLDGLPSGRNASEILYWHWAAVCVINTGLVWLSYRVVPQTFSSGGPGAGGDHAARTKEPA